MNAANWKTPSSWRVLPGFDCSRTSWAFVVLFVALVGRSLANPVDTKTVTLPVREGRDIRFWKIPATAGLSQTRVSDIVQDDEGFIWFGTQNGLNRFDGYTCKVFRHDPERPDSLSGAYVHALFKDHSGFLWVASDQFLDRFDPTTGAFTHYSLGGTDGNGLAATIGHISQDGTGSLWLSTSNGLIRLDPATGRSVRFLHDSHDAATIGDSLVNSTGEDRRGRFWVATGQTLDEFDRASGKVKRHIAIPNSGIGVGFHEDRFGVFWIFYGVDALPAILNPESGQITRFRFNPDPHPDPTTSRVYAMLEDRKGDMWFGTAGNGVLKFDREHRRFIAYGNRAGDVDSLADNRVTTLFEDREGTIWVGLHRAEPNFFNNNRPSFERFRHESGNPKSLPLPFVSALYQDRDGTLWVGTERGVMRINRSTGQYSTLSPMTGNEVLSIIEQGPDSLWIGTTSGIKHYDRTTGRLTEYPVPRGSSPAATEPAAGTCGQSIAERLLLDQGGTLWGATWEGLCRFDPSSQRFMTFKPQGNSHGLNYHAIALDKDGKLWLGSELGLHQFDPLTGHFTIYSHRSGDAHSLSDNRVNSVYIDHAGTLWAGTQDGLDKFDPRSNRFSIYGEQQGMRGNVVSCVLEDRQGSLWLSTNKGISKFDPRTESFKNYTVADGLPGDDLTGWGACFKSDAGEMFFGGFSGAAAFFPDRIADDPFVPPIVLTDFKLFGSSVPLGKNSPLTRSIGHTDEVTLSHTQNVFAIEFSALSYLNASSIRYRYRLEGLESQWNEVDGDHRVAAYTTLPRGTYTFRVEAATGHGYWGEPGARLRIRILPPWWETFWFQLSAVVLTFMVLCIVYVRRMNQVAANVRSRMEERLRERERIARELHDTLLQGVLSASIQLDLADEQLPNESPVKGLIQRVLDTLRQVTAEGRMALTGLRFHNVENSDLSMALLRVEREFPNKEEIAFRVITQGTIRAIKPEIRNEIYRIGREAIANAYVHSEGTTIEVEIQYGSGQLGVLVRDDGRGIDAGFVQSGREGHWGLSGMRERSQGIGATFIVRSRSGAGTEIEVTIPGHIAFEHASDCSWSRWISWLNRESFNANRVEDWDKRNER